MALRVAASLAASKLHMRLSSWRLRAFTSTLTPVSAAFLGISPFSANFLRAIAPRAWQSDGRRAKLASPPGAEPPYC